MAEQQSDQGQESATVLGVPLPADVYRRLASLAEESRQDARALARDLIVAQLGQRDDRAVRRRAYLSRIRAANAETLERLAEL